MEPVKTLWYEQETDSIGYIDETKLPAEFTFAYCRSVPELCHAIAVLGIRGAPALGVAGALGVALATRRSKAATPDVLRQEVTREAAKIASVRPTAVNLSWGVSRVLRAVEKVDNTASAREAALVEAMQVAEEDSRRCHALGDFGAALLPDTATVLTHCNAGALACSEWGTALGVIRSAVSAGKSVKVIACETRPLLQGARLTSWELARDRIPVTVITDSAAASLMRKGEIDSVIVGADRITHDALFNKIGTYMHAVTARYHRIPFYVAAPVSTFDFSASETDIIVEERDREEIVSFLGRATVPDEVPVRNPGFDATPLDLVSALITDEGVLTPPYDIRAWGEKIGNCSSQRG
jgi:methylthioribose-1-phosphate isomerase